MADIKIGKRYRLDIRPNPEYCCPSCGRMFGNMKEDGKVVTVTGPSTYTVICAGCSRMYPSPEGLFAVNIQSYGRVIAYPYTWLTPIEGEDYE